MKCLSEQNEKTLAETSIAMERLCPCIKAPKEQELPTFTLSEGSFRPD